MSEDDQARGFPQISRKAEVYEDARSVLSRWREIKISEDRPEADDKRPLDEAASDQVSWPDEASSAAAKKLRDMGIHPPWRHGDKFGERFQVTGLRAGGFGVVLIVESVSTEGKRKYAAKTLQGFLKPGKCSQGSLVKFTRASPGWAFDL
jgi:hypothetical protein